MEKQILWAFPDRRLMVEASIDCIALHMRRLQSLADPFGVRWYNIDLWACWRIVEVNAANARTLLDRLSQCMSERTHIEHIAVEEH